MIENDIENNNSCDNLTNEEPDKLANNFIDSLSTLLSGVDIPDIPSYAGPTLASSRPDCANDELDRIRNSYRTGSCYSLKNLPSKLKSGAVSKLRQERILDNRMSSGIRKDPPKFQSGYFRPFEYQYSDYDKARMSEKNEEAEKQIQRTSTGRRPFSIPNRMKSKLEDAFGDTEYQVPYMGPSDGKKDITDFTRSDLNDTTLYHSGQFNPAGRKRSEITRPSVREWMNTIFKKLSEDWPTLKFTLRFTDDDELHTLFTFKTDENSSSNLPRIPPNNALGKYMKTLCNTGVAGELKFKLRGDMWNIPDPNTIDNQDTVTLIYAMYAPWVKRGGFTIRTNYSSKFRKEAAQNRQELLMQEKKDELEGNVKPWTGKFQPGPSAYKKKRQIMLARGKFY